MVQKQSHVRVNMWWNLQGSETSPCTHTGRRSSQATLWFPFWSHFIWRVRCFIYDVFVSSCMHFPPEPLPANTRKSCFPKHFFRCLPTMVGCWKCSPRPVDSEHSAIFQCMSPCQTLQGNVKGWFSGEGGNKRIGLWRKWDDESRD